MNVGNDGRKFTLDSPIIAWLSLLYLFSCVNQSSLDGEHRTGPLGGLGSRDVGESRTATRRSPAKGRRGMREKGRDVVAHPEPNRRDDGEFRTAVRWRRGKRPKKMPFSPRWVGRKRPCTSTLLQIARSSTSSLGHSRWPQHRLRTLALAPQLTRSSTSTPRASLSVG